MGSMARKAGKLNFEALRALRPEVGIWRVSAYILRPALTLPVRHHIPGLPIEERLPHYLHKVHKHSGENLFHAGTWRRLMSEPFKNALAFLPRRARCEAPITFERGCDPPEALRKR